MHEKAQHTCTAVRGRRQWGAVRQVNQVVAEREEWRGEVHRVNADLDVEVSGAGMQCQTRPTSACMCVMSGATASPDEAAACA